MPKVIIYSSHRRIMFSHPCRRRLPWQPHHGPQLNVSSTMYAHSIYVQSDNSSVLPINGTRPYEDRSTRPWATSFWYKPYPRSLRGVSFVVSIMKDTIIPCEVTLFPAQVTSRSLYWRAKKMTRAAMAMAADQEADRTYCRRINWYCTG